MSLKVTSGHLKISKLSLLTLNYVLLSLFRVRCYTCGSLYSTDAPNCPVFNAKDSSQSKECDVGEACLYYSWRTSDTDVCKYFNSNV